MEDVLHSTVETGRPLIEQMGNQLTVTLPASPIVVIPLSVANVAFRSAKAAFFRGSTDDTRLSQVFLNVLNYAATYSDKDGSIGLTAERHVRLTL